MRENIAHFLALRLTIICAEFYYFLKKASARGSYSIIKRCPLIAKDVRTRYKEKSHLYGVRRANLLKFLYVYYFVLRLFGIRSMPIKEPRKYIFCRPAGGLNDMLCQIELAVTYALRYRRVIYIDGSRGGFMDNFERYFTIREKESEWLRFGVIDFLTPPFDCYPHCLRNDILNYKSELDPIVDNMVEKESQIKLDFNMGIDYKEQVIVYEQCGNNNRSLNVFYLILLADNARSHINKVINSLGEYDAVHIRHSDYRTDYEAFLLKIRNNIISSPRPLVLCSDSYEVQRYAKTLFGNRVIFSSKIPNTNGKPLHYNAELDGYETNMTALTDLFVLASAKQLYLTQTAQGVKSGFGTLARNLNKHLLLLSRLLGRL
ncbi:MAG: hypothetical protein LBO72_07070 [Helicobacteraceae bacterium]|jgi:hypothetical protein|nr:hypothetical protein [Helicobacteraceae bacterium]